MAITEARGTKLNLEANGGAITAGSYVEADNDTIATTDNANYPFMRLVLEFTYGVAPTAKAPVSILQARQNIIDTTEDEAVPSDDNQNGLLWTVEADDVTNAQRFASPVIPRDPQHEIKLYVHNGDAAQSISAGWKLDVTPLTYEDT